jgi:hypothetical protein
MLVLPGNHDIPLLDVAARLFRPYARYLASSARRWSRCWRPTPSSSSA